MTGPFSENPRLDAKTIRPRRIVVRGLNWLGDAVMSTPALAALHESFPEATIALVTPEKLAALWERHPAIQQIISFAAREGPFTLSRRLKSEHFDTGLVLPNSFRSALEFWLARIPARIGYGGQVRSCLLTRAVAPRPGAVRMRKKSAPEIRQLLSGPARPGESDVVLTNLESLPSDSSSTAHHLHQYLHLVAEMGSQAKPRAPRLFLADAEISAFAAKFRLDPNTPQPVLGLNPGAEYGPAKRWPADRFIAAALEIRKRISCRWMIFGGKGDIPIAANIAAGLTKVGATQDVLNLAGTTSLRELLVGLKLCRVLLTNDTGPMHAAAALGTPIVALFGSTSPELTGPGMPGSAVRVLRGQAACAPCFLRECPVDFRCMQGIQVESVVDAVLKQLNQPYPREVWPPG